MKLITILFTAASLLAVTSPAVAQSAQPVKSLRGDVPMETVNPAPEVLKQDSPQGGFTKAYRQAPPLIPHRVDNYQISLSNNQCLACHDWPQNVAQGAPKVSETHYRDRNGAMLDKVSGVRWFCTQCHVPQANAKPLVENTFKDATKP